MHPKYLVFTRPALLVAAALGCGAPDVSAQVVIHPEWLVAYAFPATTGIVSAEPTAEPFTVFASPVLVAESRTAFAVGLQLAALIASPETPCRGDAVEFPGFGVCFAPCRLGDTLFPGD